MLAEYYTNMTKSVSRSRLVLCCIIAATAFFRLYKLDVLPPGLHNDEVMNGYIGHFILKNGVDVYNNPWPLLYFDNFGDYPNVIPMYLSGLSMAILGPTATAIRLPIALAGVITPLLIYFIVKQATKDARAALCSAAILAFMPWHIVLSRATAEAITASAVYLTGLLIHLKALDSKSKLHLTSAYVLYLTTYVLYPSFRLFIPLAVVPTIFITKSKTSRYMSVAYTGLLALLTVYISQTVWGRGRYDQTSVFNFLDILHIRLSNLITQDGGWPVLFTRVFHNKVWVYAREIINQYMSYWSGSFLFTRGGLPTRYLLTDQGLLLITLGAQIPLYAVLKLTGKIRNVAVSQATRYLYYLTVIAPIPAALTLEDAPNVHRSLLFGVLLSIPFGILLAKISTITYRGKKLALLAIFLGFAVETNYFWHQYSHHSFYSQAEGRQTQMAEVAEYLLTHHNDYQQVYVPSQNQLALRLLLKSNDFDNTLAGTFSTGISLKTLSNISFSPESCPLPSAQATGNTLVVHTNECAPLPETSMVKEFVRTDGHIGYRAYQR